MDQANSTLNKQLIDNFSFLCNWILRYDHNFNDFQSTTWGAFKRHYDYIYKEFVALNKNNIQYSEIITFLVNFYSKMDISDLNSGSCKLLNHIIDKKFKLNDIYATDEQIEILSGIKVKYLAKYNNKNDINNEMEQLNIDENVFEEDINLLFLNNNNSKCLIVEDTQDSNNASNPPSDSQIIQLLEENAPTDDDLDSNISISTTQFQELKVLMRQIIIQNSKLSSENQAFSSKLQLIETKVSYSNLDQEKLKNDFKFIFGKYIRMKNHLRIFKNHISSNTYPNSMIRSKFPVPIFKHDNNFVSSFNSLIEGMQKQLIQFTIEHVIAKINEFETELLKIKEKITLVNINGSEIIQDIIKEVNSDSKSAIDNKDAEYKRIIRKKSSKKQVSKTKNRNNKNNNNDGNKSTSDNTDASSIMSDKTTNSRISNSSKSSLKKINSNAKNKTSNIIKNNNSKSSYTTQSNDQNIKKNVSFNQSKSHCNENELRNANHKNNESNNQNFRKNKKKTNKI